MKSRDEPGLVIIPVNRNMAFVLHALSRIAVETLRSNIERDDYSELDIKVIEALMTDGENMCRRLREEFPGLEVPFTFKTNHEN